MTILSTEPLHWSFDYQYYHGEDGTFSDELLAALRRQPDAESGICFTALPNFWKGYRGTTPIAFGSLAIQPLEQITEGRRYCVSACNTTAGEALTCSYTCDGAHRLCGTWRIETHNSAGDAYAGYRSEGRVIQEGGACRIRSRINDSLEIEVGRCSDGLAPVANFTLFERFGELLHAGPFDILEDLEKLRPANQIRPLKGEESPFEICGLTLRGYTLSGQSAVPSYWWLLPDDRVAIVSTPFQTFVRQGAAQ
jgi:hypothetical protein